MGNPTKPTPDFFEAGGSRYAMVRAPRGAEISCRGWPQEAALRMLMNSVDPDVAEAPESLTPCAALGKVAADWNAFRAIADVLGDLADDAALLVHQGIVASVLQTSADSSRVLIINSDPAASWLNIGPQLLFPESHEILSAAKREHFNGDLAGKLIAAESMSFAGAALSLAAIMQGAAFLGIDAVSERIKRYVKAGYCDVMVNNLDEALRILKNAVRKREPASVGLTGDPAEVTQEMASRGVVPDLLANAANAGDERTSALQDSANALQKLGSISLGATSRSTTTEHSNDGATVCFVALSGEPSDIQCIDRLLLELFPEDEPFARRLRVLRRRVRHQGLPARALWLSGQQSSRLGMAVNQLVAQRELKAPIVIGRLARSFSALLKRAETNAQTPTASELGTLLQLAAGATWASIAHDPKGHASLVAAGVVAVGTVEAGARIERVLVQNVSR
jgi:urocanate hydratase